MKKSKSILAIILIMALLLALCSCGKVNNDNEQMQLAQEKIIDPLSINWGMREDNEIISDKWYPNGSEGLDYIYFTTATSSGGCAYTRVMNGEQICHEYCELDDNGHLVTPAGNISIDIVFTDAFTAYDYASDIWYLRGNLKKLEEQFVGREFYEENDESNIISFEDNGKCSELYKGANDLGTWEICTATAVKCRIAGSIYYFDIIFDGDGESVAGIKQRSGRRFLAR